MQRLYESSHPWINFTLHLERAPSRFWVLLGEACAMCEQIRRTPLLPETFETLHQIYLERGVHATTAIEGNTLTVAQISQRIRGLLQLPPSKEYLGQEVDNIIGACNEILEAMTRGSLQPLTTQRIKELNRAVLEGMALEPGVIPGEIPAGQYGVADYVAAPREDCEYLLSRLCDWLREIESAQALGNRTATAIVCAVLAHLYLVWIHPFGDGNGRTARLMEHQIMAAAGVPSPATHLLSNHYNETRADYYRQLRLSSRVENGAMGFIIYSLQGFVDGLQGQMAHIQEQQLAVLWENYVNAQFRGSSRADIRKRNLALELSRHAAPTPRNELRLLSAAVAAEYARVTERTLNRDVAELEATGLIARTRHGIRARKEIILGFLPPASDESADGTE